MNKKTYTEEQAAKLSADMTAAVQEFNLHGAKLLDFHCQCMVVAERMAQSKKFKIAFKKFAKFIEDTEVRGKIQ